ncbi:MAG: quinoprotein relay system zinc metallohydrolase 2, partial [Paracoccaceae bacterium]|nr:quinoprotein relay system zinc metallohydrolase 2 [Paracoccaceae bacterium]
MFHLALMTCLATDPAVCAERVLPAPEALSETLCQTTAADHAALWITAHPDLRAGVWRCLATEDLPALPFAEIAPGVYAHQGRAEPISPLNRGDIANLGFVIGDSVAVIDAGSSRALGEQVYAAIRRVTDRPISYLILTHMHPDHSFGAEVFAESGAVVLGHANLPSALARRADTWAESIPRQIGAQTMLGTKIRLPDRGIAAPEDIDLGGATLRLVPVATAHTDNDLTVYHLQSGTLFSGDLIFADLLPVIDGSILGWLNWLAGPPAPVPARIVAGHGPVPMAWDVATAPIRDYLTVLA